jgi:branched-chain amino acid transport system substrate-binding protein
MAMVFRKHLSILLVIAFIFTSSVGCQRATISPGSGAASSGDASDGVQEVYKIGFLAAVTGGGSALGEPERDVAVMLQKQLDAEGGIVGPDGVRRQVKLLIYDTQTDGGTAISVVKKLIEDEGVVGLIGPTTSPVAMALLPVVQEAELPIISMASSSAIVNPVAERKWVFKVAQSNEHTSPWQVKYVKAKGMTRVANLYVDNAYGLDGAEAIRRTAEAEGVEIVLEDTFAAADKDMTGQLTKIRASNAEAVLVTAIPPAAAIFTKQYREMGLTLPLLHNSGVAMKPFIDLAGVENVEGVIFPMGKLVATYELPDDDPQKAVLIEFVERFQEETGKEPSTFAGHAWDSIFIMTEALATLESGLSLAEQRRQLRDAIENTKGFVGVDGVFNFTPDDHVGLSMDDIVLAKITDGDWVYFPPENW